MFCISDWQVQVISILLYSTHKTKSKYDVRHRWKAKADGKRDDKLNLCCDAVLVAGKDTSNSNAFERKRI